MKKKNLLLLILAILLILFFAQNGGRLPDRNMKDASLIPLCFNGRHYTSLPNPNVEDAIKGHKIMN